MMAPESGKNDVSIDRHRTRRRPSISRVGLVLGGMALSCGDRVLDLGSSATTCPLEQPCYAPREELRREPVGGVPTVMASHQYGATALTIDATRIYWTTQLDGPDPVPQPLSEIAVVRSCAKDDCAGTLVTYATHQQGATMIAVNDADVFWAANTHETSTPSAIVACPIAGCNGSSRTVMKGAAPNGLTVDETHVYWLSSDALLRCPVTGCDGDPTVVAALGKPTDFSFLSNSVISDGMSIFVPASDGTRTARIVQLDKEGGQPARIVADSVHQPQSLAVDAANVYWTEANAASIERCPRTGCEGGKALIAERTGYGALLAVQPHGAYWFSSVSYWMSTWNYHVSASAPADLLACPLAGCGATPAVLFTETDGPMAIAADATHVYWTSRGQAKGEGPTWSNFYVDGAVKRVRRR